MSWGAETNIKGPKGDKGDKGDPGTPGAPGSGSGDVVGPAGAVADDIAVFSGTTGKIIKDGGKKIVDLALATDLALKADKTYVDTQDALKADETYVDTQDALKADKTYVDTQDALRVRYDAAQALTAAQQVQARQNIYAAPFDALAYNGMQVNGSMEVDQPALGGIPSGNSIDGWIFSNAGSGTITLVRSNGSLTPGFNYYLALTVTAARASFGATDLCTLSQPIEGYRVARLGWGGAGAMSMTIGFWSLHSRAGTYTLTATNMTDRSYAVAYTQVNSGIPQYNIVTIPGPTSGTWNITNGLGIRLFWSAGCGTTYTAPSNDSWVTGVYYSGVGQINGVAATSDTIRLTGVVVLPGIEAPSAARSPLIMRPYDQELVTCKRYLQYNYAAADIANASGAGVTFAQGVSFGQSMRAAPSLVTGSPNIVQQATIAFTNSGPHGVHGQITSTAAGRCYWYGLLTCDARL